MCFNLGKNYILRICWTLGVTRLKRKLTLNCSVITSKGEYEVAFCFRLHIFFVFRIYDSNIQSHIRIKYRVWL